MMMMMTIMMMTMMSMMTMMMMMMMMIITSSCMPTRSLIWLIWLLAACRLVKEGRLDTRLPREVNLDAAEVRLGQGGLI